jgi:multicomponent Na+:H+ antiporter subunit B
MHSIILATAARVLLPVLLAFSIVLLLRGHNAPGGGFSAGLVATTAFAFYLIAYDGPATRRVLRVAPQTWMGVGLLFAVGSGMGSLGMREPFMTSQWTSLTLPMLGSLHLGTPFIFDLGVYLAVVGSLLSVLLALVEE